MTPIWSGLGSLPCSPYSRAPYPDQPWQPSMACSSFSLEIRMVPRKLNFEIPLCGHITLSCGYGHTPRWQSIQQSLKWWEGPEPPLSLVTAPLIQCASLLPEPKLGEHPIYIDLSRPHLSFLFLSPSHYLMGPQKVRYLSHHYLMISSSASASWRCLNGV